MSDVLNKIKAPAIGLLVSGILNALTGFLTLLSGGARLTGLLGRENLPTDEAERIGFYIGTGTGYAAGLMSLIFAPVIFFGALKMLKGEKYALAKASAVLSILPLSCCFPLSIIFGIWAFVVLRKPEVKAFFQGAARQNFPPPPPQAW